MTEETFFNSKHVAPQKQKKGTSEFAKHCLQQIPYYLGLLLYLPDVIHQGIFFLCVNTFVLRGLQNLHCMQNKNRKRNSM